MLGHAEGLAKAAWPGFDPEVAKADAGRRAGAGQRQGARAADRRGRACPTRQLRERALADAAVRAHTDGKTIRKVVVAKGPLVSVVVS